ncbi:recombinase family protein [Acinetobacter baumannii]|uniref:Site-specific recombinase, DNA invertase Pin-like protein n=1 Tax=Acinetobacter baumannii TaxID=470 RepID=A0A0C4Y2T1_ACIBA|nr:MULTISPECIES: recombinase family protein [Acinetobacter calcoaceticus/baumannii complex]AFI97434.1 site-specific recombinase, DNA invertase Pin [Acinetobacter baumannii MDR-TJ]AGQ12327.1 Site-specific recombinase, DNA invertase Pin-like protein [Acinetobacter baumannii BJAB0868]AGQ16188.1 Site-specific recombinase, DNA invertase Pin-like protein [Acinetobacter baumannii BJAB07104]AJF79904.1 Site-specific recombinase, DNA invertase Pin-like protein [Acinetobacter baumannii]KPA48983.1 resolva
MTIAKVARVYLRVSTDSQSLERQEKVISDARSAGYYIAAVYKEKASGATIDRPELQRMINDLQSGEVVIAEKLDRISRLPLKEAENLIESIRSKGARLAIPGLVDLSEISKDLSGMSKIIVDTIQELLLKIALQMAHEDYELRRERQRQGQKILKDKRLYKGRKPNEKVNLEIIKLRKKGLSISETAKGAKCSIAQVKKIWREYNDQLSEDD